MECGEPFLEFIAVHDMGKQYEAVAFDVKRIS